MKIAFYSAKKYELEFFNQEKRQSEIEFFPIEEHLSLNTALLAKDCKVVIVFVNDKIDKKVIEILANNGVKLIALRCAGFNNVDLAACKQHNLKVVRVPAYSPNAVAEYATAMILTLNRKTHHAHARVREHNFSLHGFVGFDLYKKTVGIIGTGKIGECFANIMHGFGCKVLAFDPIKNSNCTHINYVDLDTLYKESDIISLHCPLNNETQHLINANTLNQMKANVMIINTGRGALINTPDVIEALKSKKIAHLGLDVYEEEENIFFEDLSDEIINDDDLAKLQSFPNVLITSHQGFLTKEALTNIAKTTLENIQEFVDSKPLSNEVSI